MQIKVLFFGILKDLAGQNSETLTLPEGATLAELLAQYGARYPRMQNYLPGLATAVNQVYAGRAAGLRDGDEVGLLPPVSGGSGTTVQIGAGPVALVREPIDVARFVEAIKRPEDGAIAVFEGAVRNHSRGRPTLFLEYEAYEAMALRELEGLVRAAREKFPIRAAHIVHRLGRLEIGETSVVIAVASAHRGSAFDACRWLIDTLKQTVPIWKKEYFADGAVWAPGEPFPESLCAPRAPGEASK